MSYKILGKYNIIKNSEIGEGTVIWSHNNIYDSRIGRGCKIASHVEIGGSELGDECSVQKGAYIHPGINDDNPGRGEFHCLETIVEDLVRIGAGAKIRPGITLHEGCFVGMGSVVTKSVPEYTLVYGNPARKVRKLRKEER